MVGQSGCHAGECIPEMIKLSYVIKNAARREELVFQQGSLYMRIDVAARNLMGRAKLIHWNTRPDTSLTRQ